MITPESSWTPYPSTDDAHRATLGPIRFVQPPGLKPLKRKYVMLLLNDSPNSKSATEQLMKSIAMSAFLAEWPRDHVAALLAESPAFGQLLQRKPELLEPLLSDARRRATPEQVEIHVENLLADIATARGAAQSIRWSSTPDIRVSSGATTMVLLAVLSIAEQAKTATDLHLAVRRVGLESGTNRSVASRALKLLTHYGVLTKSPANQNRRRFDADGYNLHLDAVARMSATRETQFDPALSQIAGHDAFRRGALSPSGFRTLAQLSPSQPLRVETIADRVSLTTAWTRTKLVQLRVYGLAFEEDSRWRRCSTDELPDRLDKAASLLGKNNETERLTAQYESEREHFRYRRISSTKKVDRDTGEVLRDDPTTD